MAAGAAALPPERGAVPDRSPPARLKTHALANVLSAFHALRPETGRAPFRAQGATAPHGGGRILTLPPERRSPTRPVLKIT